MAAGPRRVGAVVLMGLLQARLAEVPRLCERFAAVKYGSRSLSAHKQF